MPTTTLTYFAEGTPDGRYGIRGPLANGETFGSWGAIVCVIVLVKLPAGQLFCGHMACEYSGIPGNQAIVKQKAAALLTTAVGNANKGCAWAITTGGGDVTTNWMQAAITAWFTNPPQQSGAARTDAYFSDSSATFVIGKNITGGTTRVDNGDFTVRP